MSGGPLLIHPNLLTITSSEKPFLVPLQKATSPLFVSLTVSCCNSFVRLQVAESSKEQWLKQKICLFFSHVNEILR